MGRGAVGAAGREAPAGLPAPHPALRGSRWAPARGCGGGEKRGGVTQPVGRRRAEGAEGVAAAAPRTGPALTSCPASRSARPQPRRPSASRTDSWPAGPPRLFPHKLPAWLDWLAAAAGYAAHAQNSAGRLLRKGRGERARVASPSRRKRTCANSTREVGEASFPRMRLWLGARALYYLASVSLLCAGAT